MKILMFFLDMLGSRYLNICNKNAENSAMDDLLRELGGTVYCNTYSPAPDTQRSVACTWTGMYPYENHCDLRLKFPSLFINREIDNIWSILKDKNYKVNIYENNVIHKLGLVPLCGNESVYTDIEDYLENAELSDNVFNYVYTPDLHYILGECHYEKWGFKEGIGFLTGFVKKIIDYYNAQEEFDYIIMFSDHGYCCSDLEYDHIIARERCNTFMYIRKKGDNSLSLDTKLRSNMDIMPTVSEIVGYIPKKQPHGKSLFDKTGHDYVLIEDCDNFSVGLSQTIEHWCVVTADNVMHWFECSGKWEHENQDAFFDEDSYKNILLENMTDIRRNLELYEASEMYKRYFEEHRSVERYHNGEKFGHTFYRYRNIQAFAGKKIILYGAGSVGRDVFDQVKKFNECSIAAWVDLNYEDLQKEENLPVSGIKSIFEADYDFILICALNPRLERQIRNMLVQLNVPPEKIIHGDFVKVREVL